MKKVGKTIRPFRYDLNQIPYNYTVEMTNIFKGLNPIDRVPEELRTEVHDIVQEAGIKTIPKKKKCKKAKWLSEKTLRITEKRRQRRKGKIYPSECRVPKTSKEDKKVFFSDQCKEIEENNRMGKTRDLLKKIRDTEGTFHAKMGTVKDRNGMDLTEQKILRRDGRNTQKNYTKKIFMTQITTMV